MVTFMCHWHCLTLVSTMGDNINVNRSTMYLVPLFIGQNQLLQWSYITSLLVVYFRMICEWFWIETLAWFFSCHWSVCWRLADLGRRRVDKVWWQKAAQMYFCKYFHNLNFYLFKIWFNCLIFLFSCHWSVFWRLVDLGGRRVDKVWRQKAAQIYFRKYCLENPKKPGKVKPFQDTTWLYQ